MSYDVQVYVNLAQAKAHEYASQRASKGSDLYTAMYNAHISAFSWWHAELEHLKAVIQAHNIKTDKTPSTPTVTKIESVEDMI